MSRSLSLLAAAVLLGGLRDPRVAGLGEAAVFILAAVERPAFGPSAAWLPWLAWAVLSAALSLQPLASLPFLARWSAALAFFSLAASWDEAEREAWLKTVLALTAVLALAALWTGAGAGFRATMTGLLPPYYNYTTFALSAGVAAGAVLALHPWTSRREFRLAGGGVAALGSVCLAFAHGRAAVIGLAAAAIVWAARRWGAKAGFGALIAAGLLAAAFQARLLPDSMRAYVTRHGGTYQEARTGIWSGAAAIADESRWFGSGPGSFGAAFRLHPAEAHGGQARWGFGTDYAHSEPLQAAAETGWLGLALWLIGLGAASCFLVGPASEEPAREAAAIAAVAMGVHLAVDNMLQLPGLAFLFFSALAVAGARPAAERRWPRSLAAVAAVLALVAWIPRALAQGDPERAAVLFPREEAPFEELAYRATAARDWDMADALWTKAAERAPFNAVYPWRRAQIAAARGRWSDAEALARRAAGFEPGFLDDRVLHAQTLLRLGKRAEARQELTEILHDFQTRGERAGSSGYDATIWAFDRKNYDRVAALAKER
ncbi:MAG TPA: O-antigen ligase family protein [Elusimicrobiota bacterium]|nr:O-antigen ligase family protein [Elusimicrobiota bacterium]